MSSIKWRSRAASSERGQAAVELALAAPLIMVTLLGVVSLGRAAQNRATVVRAAGAAARVAVVRPDLARREALAVISAAGSKVTADDVDVELAPVEGARLPFARPTRVTVIWKHKAVTGFGWKPTIPLQASFVFDQYATGPAENPHP